MFLDFEEKVDNATQEDFVDPQYGEVDDEIFDESDEEISDEDSEGEDISLEDDSDESEETQEVAEPAKKNQSKEENAIYARLRRKAEEEARAKYENLSAELLRREQELQQAEVERRIKAELVNNPQRIWDKANEEGVSEHVAIRLLEQEARDLIETEKRKVQQKYESIRTQKNELKAKPFFGELEPEIDRLITGNPDLDVQTAYYYLVGVRSNDLVSEHKKKAVKSTIANIQDGRRRRIANDGNEVNPEKKMTDFGRRAAIFMGLDPREVAQEVIKRKKQRR